MQVKQRLRINSAVLALSIIAIISVLLVTSQRVNRAMEQNKIADKLMSAQFERLAIRTDYMRTGNERARQQVKAKNNEVGKLLKSAAEKFSDPKAKTAIATLMEGQESAGKIFRAIVANRQDSGLKSRDAAISGEIENRLLTQLNMRVYESVLLSARLKESSSAALASALKTGGGWTLFVFLLMGAATLINSVTMNSTISSRIGRLADGATAIGGGNLDHRIDIRGDDEFTELAGSFNEMTERLRESYNDLEREIEERRRIEDGLRESAAELQSANADLGDSRRAAINLMEDALDARRQAEQASAALRESEEKLTLALRSADMGVWRLDLRKQKRYFDDQVCRCLGIDPETFGGTEGEFFAAIHRDDRDRLKAVLNRTIESGEPYETEYRVMWPSGHIRHVTARGRLVRDATGQPQRVDGLLWDITERKWAEEAVRESERKYSILFDTLSVAAALTKLPEIVFSDVNNAFEKLFGYTREEVVGKTSLEVGIARPEEHKVTSDEIERQGRHLDAEKHVFTKSGEERIVLINAIALELNGQSYSLTTLQDITERKQAEERLKASLREKEVMLKEIHHRVKNNLQIISSLVGLQADGTRDETVREVLRDVTYRVRSMALVHEKLYQSADLARIDFAEYAKSLLSYLWRAHGSTSAVIRLKFDLEPLSLPVDTAVPCGLILNELAGNALKHAFRGRDEGEVTVSLLRDPEGRVSLCLRDNGVGMPAELDWRQAHSLGLRLVQMLAGQLNATVELDRDGGTEFRLIFILPETAKDGESLHE